VHEQSSCAADAFGRAVIDEDEHRGVALTPGQAARGPRKTVRGILHEGAWQPYTRAERTDTLLL